MSNPRKKRQLFVSFLSLLMLTYLMAGSVLVIALLSGLESALLDSALSIRIFALINPLIVAASMYAFHLIKKHRFFKAKREAQRALEQEKELTTSIIFCANDDEYVAAPEQYHPAFELESDSDVFEHPDVDWFANEKEESEKLYGQQKEISTAQKMKSDTLRKLLETH